MWRRTLSLIFTVAGLAVVMAISAAARWSSEAAGGIDGLPAWLQSNEDGFGDPDSTQVPSLAVFGERLYAGVWHYNELGDPSFQIWRTADGESWEKVADEQRNGAAHLIVFDGYLYAGTWDGTVWRSPDGLAWTEVVSDGFGDPGNGICRFAVFGGELYATTWNETGTEVWRTTDGTTWAQFGEDGLGDGNNDGAIASETFGGDLYFGVVNGATGAQLWRTDGATWTALVTDGFGTPDNDTVSSLAAYDGSLYAGVGNPAGVQVWRSSDGAQWEQVVSGGFGNPYTNWQSALEVYDGKLYMVAGNEGTGLEVWRTANGTAWEQVGFGGFGDANNGWSYWDNGTTTFGGSLWVATNNYATGGEVWQMVQYPVGLVADESGFGDVGFNWMALQGLLRAESELGVYGRLYEPASPDDYEANLQQCADDGNILCLSVGFAMGDATLAAAQNNPATHFAIADVTWESYPDNLRGMGFAEEHAGYLAGTLAGLMTGSGVVGGVGGAEIPPVVAFLETYRNGALCADPWVGIVITYTGVFTDPVLGAQVAQEQMAQGADVVFGAAGPTGDGAILYATQNDAWGIGVDTDQWVTLFLSGTVEGSDRLLTSAMKRVDNAVYETIADEVLGVFTPGTVEYGLATGGVGLAPYHEAGASIPQAVKDAVEAVRQGILDGTIDVWQSCALRRLCLPLVLNNGP